MLLKAKRHIEGLHICTPKEKLLLWSSKQADPFRKYAEIHRELSEKIRNRRIFVYEKDRLSKTNGVIRTDDINHEEVKEIFEEQILPISEGGMGVKLGILDSNIIKRDRIEISGDFLVIDGEEVFIVGGGEDLPYLDAEASVNPGGCRGTYATI